jgi:hypothetical protein
MTKTQGQWVIIHCKERVVTLLLMLAVLTCSIAVNTGSYNINRMTEENPQDGILVASAQTRIAVVKPIFTATAYSSAFYTFYYKYASLPEGQYATTDLDLLNRTVVDTWGWSSGLDAWFQGNTAQALHLVPGGTVTVLDEIDVVQGALFSSDKRLYDVLVLGFTEYVTKEEYLYYKQFVASGGTLILMDACNFLAEVTYSNGYLSLTKGHGWEFNGTHAWKSVYHRWPEDNMNWIGGNYWQYWTGTHYCGITVNTTNSISDYIRSTMGEVIPSSYRGHEENLLQNMTDTEIIGYWNFINPAESPAYPVAAYIHRYRDGLVIHSGIMASDVVRADAFLSLFLATSIRYGLAGEVSPWTYPGPLFDSNDPVDCTIVAYQSDGEKASGELSGPIHIDINFNTTSDVLRNCHSCNLHSVSGEIASMMSENQTMQNTIVEAKAVNETCWRLDINTYSLMNGEYTVSFNATWKSIEGSFAINETTGVIRISVFNSWWMQMLPWGIPLGAAICAVVVLVVYTKFTKAKLP